MSPSSWLVRPGGANDASDVDDVNDANDANDANDSSDLSVSIFVCVSSLALLAYSLITLARLGEAHLFAGRYKSTEISGKLLTCKEKGDKEDSKTYC